MHLGIRAGVWQALTAAAAEPLEGLRVVESSAFIAAPLAGMTMAQMGADVIRIDPIGGGIDHGRWPVSDDGQSLYWASLNKHKRSIAIDTRQPEGRELAASLVAAPGSDAGVFLTNLPASGWRDFAALKARRHDLIMLCITGNRDGSTAVDYTVNCATGLPFLTGPEGSAEPVNHALPVWDVVCATTAVNGLLVAERHRRRTGEGQYVKLALSDVAFAAMGNLGYIAEAQINGKSRQRIGNKIFGTFGRDFATNDGRRVMVAAVTKRQWGALVAETQLAHSFEALARETNLDLRREGDRYRASDAVAALLEPWFAARTLAQIRQTFAETAVCWGTYQTIDQTLAEDERCSSANPMFEEVEQPGVGRYLMPGPPLEFGAMERPPVRAAPVLGQHTDEILSGIVGLSDRQIGTLHDRQIVAAAAISIT